MDEYYRLIQALPPALAEALNGLPSCHASRVQEIRLRAEQPAQFTMNGKLVPCQKYLPRNSLLSHIRTSLLQDCFLQLCRRSVYAYESELRQGFFTVAGGNRIGVAGSWNGNGFSAITSLNLRVARWVTCQLPQPVITYLSENACGGLLIAGPPGSGKTTFLRTLVQYLGQTDAVVCVVDERGELMAGEADSLPQARQIACDVYTRCPKAEGICMALRCMNPAFIVCDELGTEEDIAAVERGIASGVRFLASVHCDHPENLRQKIRFSRLLASGAFPRAAFLSGREKPGTIEQWVDLL